MSLSMTKWLLNSRMFMFYIFTVLILTENVNGYFKSPRSAGNDKQCFCELKGSIDDCSCNVDTVDHFNNVKIYPRLRSLLVKDYFRFYKVNLKQTCPFWADDSKCAMKFCHVQPCEDKDIPAGIKGYRMAEKPEYKYTESAQVSGCTNDFDVELSYLNTSISDKTQLEFQLWADYDDAQDNFCILDDHQDGAEYVDLLLNPERYTGYKGESAHRIWRSIYLENCFGSNKRKSSLSFIPYIPYTDMSAGNGICMEQRAFYRLISGLHSSINIHLSSIYLLSEKKEFISETGVWGPNVEEFTTRFSPASTNNEGPHWLRNLYFIYIVELRALAKAAPYLRNASYFTGAEEEDEEVLMAIRDLLNVIESFPNHFNETTMFSDAASLKLKREFKEKFRNISKIMDCVGCDKCRLWGKLQIQGLGTALKILFSGKFDNAATLEDDKDEKLKLKRTEIVSLFNAFGRLSTSINELEKFRQVLR